MNDLLIELIKEYLLKVNKAVLVLAKKYEDELLLTSVIEAYKTGKIPKRGQINSRCTFEFHGIGCRVKFPDFDVDFDFGACSITGGFDKFKLKKFLSSLKDNSRYEALLNQDVLNESFENLISNKVIYQPDFKRSKHLYYLR